MAIEPRTRRKLAHIGLALIAIATTVCFPCAVVAAAFSQMIISLAAEAATIICVLSGLILLAIIPEEERGREGEEG